MILLLVLSACGGGGDEGQAGDETEAAARATSTSRPEQPTQAATTAPTAEPVEGATPEPVEGATPEPVEGATPEPVEGPTAEPEGAGPLTDLLNLDSLTTDPERLSESALQSYRLRVQWTVEPKPGSDATPSDSRIEIAHTRDPLAEQTTFFDQGGIANGVIRVGDKLWFQTGTEWIEVSSDDMASSLQDTFFDLNSIAAGLTGDARLVGEEEINGVDARHYSFDETILGTALGAYDKISGDVWVAKEGEYVVKYAFTSEDAKATYRWIWEVHDVNAPFTIEPPAGAQGAREDVPLMPDATERSSFGAMTTYETAGDLGAVIDFYTGQMPGQGWTYDEAASMVGDEFAMLNFTKDGTTVTITLTPSDGGGASVLIQVGE
jgi:hypothetical protein